MEDLKIVPPEGYVIDKENSTFECIKFKPKRLTYSDITKSLFFDKRVYFINKFGCIKYSDDLLISECDDPNNCCSEKQAEKLLAINKLMNIATYLNNGWKFDFNDDREYKYYLIYSNVSQKIEVNSTLVYNFGLPYFKSIELARKAIDILGEDTIKLALS